jgi:hypothetical protein
MFTTIKAVLAMTRAKKIFFIFISVLLISLLAAAGVSALRTDGAGNAVETGDTDENVQVEGDYYYMFDSAKTGADSIKGKIGGDIIALGSDLQIEAEVGGNIRSAALTGLTINNTSVKNITVASMEVDIGEGTKSKAVYAGANTFKLYGTCEYLEVYATDVYIYGNITDSANIHADNVYFADNCDVNNVKVEGMNKPQHFQKDNTSNAKDYTENQTLAGKITFKQTQSELQKYMSNLLYTLPAAIVLTLLLCLLLGKQLDESGAMFRNTTGRHLGYGMIGAFLIPIAIFFMIALPYTSSAGFVLGLGYILLAVTAESFTAASISRILMPKVNKYLSSLIGITVVTMLTLLSAVSVAFTIFSLVYIFGYTINKLFIKKTELPHIDNNTFQM